MYVDDKLVKWIRVLGIVFGFVLLGLLIAFGWYYPDKIKTSETVSAQQLYKYSAPDLERVSELNGRYAYVIDKSTGVVYIEGEPNGALSVAYNSDGTIMTEENLKLNNKE